MIQHYCVHSKRLLSILAALLLAGCGNEFRPVAIPIIPPGGTPQALKHAVVVSNSSGGATSTNIDVAGDTVFAVRDVGPNPVHAALVSNQSRVLISNDNDTLSTYINLLPLVTGPTNTISLPPNSNAGFVHSREAANAYVALRAPDPACGGNGAIAVVAMTTFSLVGTACAGINPVAMAELPNASKIYVANQGSNNVTVINTADRSIAATIQVGNSPSSIEVSADGAFVYVANRGSNTVTAIDTSTDQQHPNSPLMVGTGPHFIRFDPAKKRIYTVNSDSVTVIDADPASPGFLLPPGSIPVGANPSSLTVLANGNKVYVANSGPGANSVSVIDATALTVISSVTVGITPIDIGSSPDSAQVFVANQGDPTGALTGTVSSGNVSVIRTSDDVKIIDIALPPPPSLPPGTPAPVMTPKILFVSP